MTSQTCLSPITSPPTPNVEQISPKNSTTITPSIDFDNDVTDSFVLDIQCDKELFKVPEVDLKEIPAATDDQVEGEIVAEFVVDDVAFHNILTQNENFAEFESEELTQNCCESSDKNDPYHPSNKKGRKAQYRLVSTVNNVFIKLNLPHRVSSTDIRLEVDSKTSILKASAKCLLCPIWFSVPWSGYTYKVHNYKSHLIRKHVRSTIAGGKQAMKKVQLTQPMNKKISAFFQPKNTSASASAVQRRVEVLQVETFDPLTHEFRQVSKYTDVEMTENLEMLEQADEGQVKEQAYKERTEERVEKRGDQADEELDHDENSNDGK